MISIDISSMLAWLDTWQRKIWLWSAGVRKSVRIAELEKNVWLPIELKEQHLCFSFFDRIRERKVFSTVELIVRFYTIQILDLDKHVSMYN